MSVYSLLCTGQGAQTPDLFSRFPFAERGLALRQRVLDGNYLEPDVAAWILDPARNPSAIFQNHFSQPLLCLYQCMIWAELAPLLPRPALIAGYSLGEVTAYACAGAFQPEEAIRLAGTRARLMDAAGPPARLLAVTGLSPTTAANLPGAHLAIVIAHDHCVIGCLAERAESLAHDLKTAGAIDAHLLPVSVASHTPILDAAVAPFRAALDQMVWNPPHTPILAGISSVKITRREQMEQTLPEQIHRTVRWDQIQQRLEESACHVYLELGPGTQLAHMALSQKLEARSATEFRSAEGVAAWLEKALARNG